MPLLGKVLTVDGAVPPETRPTSAMILRMGRLNERSAKMLLRVIVCATETLGDVRPAIRALAVALDSYRSWPYPAATPKRISVLLATSRHAVVSSSRSLTVSVEPTVLPVNERTGKSRRRYVSETPGTTMDSCSRLR